MENIKKESFGGLNVGKMSRKKGHSYERIIAQKLRKVYPRARRLLEYQEGVGHDIERVGPFKIQCKRYKDYAPISKIKEVKGDGVHCLVTRGDREKDVICLYLDDFINILEQLQEARDDS
jgi:hypothetical protein